MAQTTALIATLKKQLKAHGLTYADLAKAMELSEASVKRLFSEENFTLARLETVCQLMGMKLDELFALMAKNQPQLTQLEEKQEQDIVNDAQLLMITISVINGYSMRDLLQHYTLSETECINKLAMLDRLKIIELLPGNRIKLLVSPNFRWIPNGPIQKFFIAKVQQEFFKSKFENDEEKLLVLNGMFSRASNSELQKKMAVLAREFNELIQSDAHLPIDEKHGNTLVLALRRWQYDLFMQFIKK